MVGIDKITGNIIFEYHNRALVALIRLTLRMTEDILLSIAQTIMGRTKFHAN